MAELSKTTKPNGRNSDEAAEITSEIKVRLRSQINKGGKTMQLKIVVKRDKTTQPRLQENLRNQIGKVV